jgi:GT2 family glycosyltransferase
MTYSLEQGEMVMSEPKVTILVPNYKTLDLTKLCLRLLRKHTDSKLAKVVVIDNDSQDESLVYLRSLSWIELIERQAKPDEGAIAAHSAALDLALEQVKTPYVLSIHTDTLVKRPDWLTFLLGQIEHDDAIAGVGSWKLENKAWYKRWLKNIERQFQLAFFNLTGQKIHAIEGKGKNYYYLRSHCALYRTDLLRQYQLHFSDGDKLAGKALHRQLEQAGYKMIFIPSDVLCQYIEHINHATTVLHPSLSRGNNLDKGLRRIKQSLEQFNAKAILADDSLDN